MEGNSLNFKSDYPVGGVYLGVESDKMWTRNL